LEHGRLGWIAERAAAGSHAGSLRAAAARVL